jgi:hypothetical protein
MNFSKGFSGFSAATEWKWADCVICSPLGVARGPLHRGAHGGGSTRIRHWNRRGNWRSVPRRRKRNRRPRRLPIDHSASPLLARPWWGSSAGRRRPRRNSALRVRGPWYWLGRPLGYPIHSVPTIGQLICPAPAEEGP